MRRASGIAIAALVLAWCVAPTAAQPRAVTRIVVVQAGELYAAEPATRSVRRLTRNSADERAPALAPDGRVAFERSGDVWVLDARQRERRVARGGGTPAWSPDGRSLAVVTRAGIAIVPARGGTVRSIAGTAGASGPAWSPDGLRIAFARDGDIHAVDVASGVIQPLVAVTAADASPAWAPSGTSIAIARRDDTGFRIVAVDLTTGAEIDVTGTIADARAPAWSPDGARIAFASAGAVHVTSAAGPRLQRVTAGDDPAWGVVSVPPVPPLLLPDLDQRPPAGLTVTRSRGRWLLGFASATDNIGRGPIWIRARRPSRATPVMRVDQLIRIARGGIEVARGVGIVRYVYSSSHSHWHLMRYQRYELRRAGNFAVIAADRKSGFCLADHYGISRLVARRPPPTFNGNCALGEPQRLAVEQGTSVGYSDRYFAHFHGQNVDISRVAAGRYWLVHRANARGLIQERTLANNAASVLVRLAWPGGRGAAPSVTVLRTCENAERC